MLHSHGVALQSFCGQFMAGQARHCRCGPRFIVASLMLLLWLPHAYAAVTISSARIWPAQDYTRLTIESKNAIRHNMFTLSDPERLVIDLERVELSDTLNELTSKISDNDPYIKSMRVGRFKPGVVRLVLDLKSEVNPQLFVLKPVSEYGYRLVLDIYPAHPIDPLTALLEQIESRPPEASATSAATEQPADKIPGEDKLQAQIQNIDKSKISPSPIPNPPELRARTLIIT